MILTVINIVNSNQRKVQIRKKNIETHTEPASYEQLLILCRQSFVPTQLSRLQEFLAKSVPYKLKPA